MHFRSKIIALLFLLVWMTGNAGLREFFKIPLLVDHYCDHLQENPHTTVWRFLVMHYSLEDGSDSDAGEDAGLPFKSAEGIPSSQQFNFHPVCQEDLSVPEYVLNAERVFTPAGFIPDGNTSEIWRPPCMS